MTPSAGSATTRRIEDLPGPRGWPWLGNLPQLRMSRIHLDIEAWGRRYGPLFKVDLGSELMLVVTDHEMVSGVLRDRPDGFRRTSRLRRVGAELGSMPGVSSAEGESWRNQRRMVVASFAAARIRTYFPLLLEVTHRLQARWRRAARERATIDLQADLKRYTVQAIVRLAFGNQLDLLDSDDSEILRHLETILSGVFRRMVSPVPYWRVLRLPADRRLERSMVALRETVDSVVAEALRRMELNPELRANPTNMLEAMIVAADQGGAGLSHADVAGNVSTMLFAGEESTAKTLAWLIYLLHRNPATLRQAQDEVLRVSPDPARFTLEQMGALDVVEACANEAMRLKPVLPFNAVEALHDTAVADVAVPAGTMVWCVMRHDSVDERYFPDAQTFDPQRWLQSEQRADSLGRVSMSFGSGPRMCPGRYLALLELKLAVAMLLSSFEIESIETPGGGDAQEVMSFMMHPRGLRMRLRARSA